MLSTRSARWLATAVAAMALGACGSGAAKPAALGSSTTAPATTAPATTAPATTAAPATAAPVSAAGASGSGSTVPVVTGPLPTTPSVADPGTSTTNPSGCPSGAAHTSVAMTGVAAAATGLWSLSFTITASSSLSAPVVLSAVLVQLAHPDGSVFNEIILAPNRTLGAGQTATFNATQAVQSPDQPHATSTRSNWTWAPPGYPACTVLQS